MTNLVFMLPFVVETSEPWADKLRRELKLTRTRVDDWDVQLGFRLEGRTGAIRLFKRTTEGHGPEPLYALFGTAVTPKDRSRVTDLYWECLKALDSVYAVVYKDGLIDPQKAEQLQLEGEF